VFGIREKGELSQKYNNLSSKSNSQTVKYTLQKYTVFYFITFKFLMNSLVHYDSSDDDTEEQIVCLKRKASNDVMNER
jgi:hypothetical protein